MGSPCIGPPDRGVADSPATSRPGRLEALRIGSADTAAPWFALGIVLFASRPGAQELRGHIESADGKPAAGAHACREWRFSDPAHTPAGAPPTPSRFGNPTEAAVADELGAFHCPVPDARFLFFLSADGKSGALFPVHADDEVKVTLAPLVEVRARFEVKTPGEPPKTTALWISAGEGMPSFVAECMSERGAFRVALPPATYHLWYSTDAVNLYSMTPLREEPLAIPAGETALDLGAFELELPLLLHPRGVVLDAEGKPARASLGEHWSTFQGTMNPFGGFEADEDGRFLGNVQVYDATDDHVLFALDPKREQAALVSWKPSEVATPLEVHLAPAVRVFGRYRTDSGERPAWTNTYVYVPRARSAGSRAPRFAECQSEDARFEFRLPPGTYRLNGYGTSTLSADTDVVLAAGERERDLGEIVLPQNVIARNTGKAALPWHVTDARGLAKDVNLADFRGKWVLLEFWGFW